MNEIKNHTAPRAGKCSAICECCNKRSRPVTHNNKGEPDLWELAEGWSCAPFPADYEQKDGSTGSTYRCPNCNKRLDRGERVPLRGRI